MTIIVTKNVGEVEDRMTSEPSEFNRSDMPVEVDVNKDKWRLQPISKGQVHDPLGPARWVVGPWSDGSTRSHRKLGRRVQVRAVAVMVNLLLVTRPITIILGLIVGTWVILVGDHVLQDLIGIAALCGSSFQFGLYVAKGWKSTG